MRSQGLLIAGVAVLLAGVFGLVATGLFMAYQGGRTQDGRSTYDRARPRDRGEESTETTPGAPRTGPRRRFRGPQDFSSVGERIWWAGVGAGGPVPREPAFGPAMMGGCAVCHGEDGRGSRFVMMGREFDAPDIRPSRLMQPHEEDGRTAEAWTEDDIARAVREGVEPNGERLEDTMPRWDISDADLEALLTHMRGL